MSDIPVLPSTDVTAVDVATDTVGVFPNNKDYQVVKLAFGADGAATRVQDIDGARWPIGGAAFGTPGDAAATTDTGSFSFIALFKRLLSKIQDRSKVSTATPVQVTCDATADPLISANTARKEVLLKNLGPYTIYLGKSGVTIATGYELLVGETLVDDLTTQQWFGITLSGTSNVSVLEL